MRKMGRRKRLRDLVVQQLDGLGLDLGARKPVDDDPRLVGRLEQLAQQRLDHLAIADELAAILQRAHLGGVEQVAHDDRRRGQAALAKNERRVGPFARAGGAAQPHDLLGEDHVLEAALLYQAVPDLPEDQRGVFDLQLGRCEAGGAGIGGPCR
jgi:hypothetical protein